MTAGGDGGAPVDDRLCLAVDLGTGGPKVGLVTLDGRLVRWEHVAVETSWLGDGGAEQDAAGWWEVIRDVARRSLREVDPAGRRVDAVSVTGQWASTVPVDERGHPVAGCVMWMDTRGRPHARRAYGGPVAGYRLPAAAAWLRRNGVPPSVEGDDSLGHMLHLAHDRPATAAAARWYLEPVDYLSMRFCGVAAASPASMTASWLLDTRRPGTCAYDPVLVRRSGVDAAKLPPLRPTASVIGPVLPDVAADLGLPPGTSVVAGTPDLHSAAVGAGAVGDYEAHLAISTTSWISCPVPRKKTDPFHQLATVPGVTPDRYLLVDNQDNAGRCLEWLRDRVVTTSDGYADLVELAAAAPAGSGGVLFTPWLTGERSPVGDRRARAGFHNVSLATERSHLARSVLEGVAMNSRWLLGAAERFCGRRLEPIRLIGGGARSDLWAQILADVLDRRIERVAEPVAANLRGAALLAGAALGAVRLAQVRDLVPVDRVFGPDPAHRAVYDRMSAELPRLYRAQKGTFARLNAGAS
ncbi:MAG TPA: FGGY-family carbohydrate kinase [Acidimicrobiales bacterium]|nr:FGGY-family carbohydrate kinase [Acidimicrobiales bacterium]